MAPANRIINYGIGLIANYCKVTVAVYKPTESIDNVRNDKNRGFLDGIEYIYPGKETIRSTNYLIRRIQDLSAAIKTILFIIEQKKNNNNIDFIIYYSNGILFQFIIIIICKIFGIKILKEESEHPIINHSFAIKLPEFFRKTFILLIYDLFDGILVMTKPIYLFLRDMGVKENKIIIIPQVIEASKYEGLSSDRDNNNNKYILYSGSLNDDKDGVLSLIEAFKLVNKSYPEIYMKILGFGSSIEIERLNKKIETSGLTDKVQYLGQVNPDELRKIQAESMVLVLCRPKSIQAEYGFPSKLVEYLATGVPVVTTSYGDSNNYLIDGVNVFISSSNNPIVFGSRIFDVLKDIKKAQIIAQAGKKMVKEKFNPVTQTKKIIKFMESII